MTSPTVAAASTKPASTKPASTKRASTKPAPPEPAQIVRRIGDTSEQALAYVLDPDPKLSRLGRKVRERLLPELPPVTAAAMLGPAALARHFVASAAAGRYRDLFFLWELFRARPDDCKPVLAERAPALERGRGALETAARLGLAGRANRVAEDVARAHGLVWDWLRAILVADLAAVGRRPAVASALAHREPDLDIPLPGEPDERWLLEAAEARRDGSLAERVDQLLAANVERLPATVVTLSLAHDHYPAKVTTLLDRVDLDRPDVEAILAWARDHGHIDRLRERVTQMIIDIAARDRADALARWHQWRDRHVDVPLPESLQTPSLEGLDATRPETAELIAMLRSQGAALDAQHILAQLAADNRQRAEKAYEAFVCAGLDVTLPGELEGNPIVKDGTRCPHCRAWTWVRPGHERRCPRATEAMQHS